MDFTSLLDIAHKNDKANKKEKLSGFKTELPAPKREKQEKKRSEVVQRLIDEKRRERDKEKMKNEKPSDASRTCENDQRNTQTFRIPKKNNLEMEDLMRELESGDEDSDPPKKSNGIDKYDKQKSDHSEKRSDKPRTVSVDRNSDKKHASEKTSGDKHRSESSKHGERPSSSKSSSGSSDKHGQKPKKASNLSLDELRAEVFKMKEEAQQMEKEKEKEKLKPFDQTVQKARQGVVEDKMSQQAKILSRTQMILERTKAKFAEERAGIKPQRQRGKRSGDKERAADKSGDKVKSRSTVKDDDSDDDMPNHQLDMSFNQDLLQNESGADMMKNIKKKIDEKLTNYHFPDRPEKEKKVRTNLPQRKVDRGVKKRDPHDRHRDKYGNKMLDKKQKKRDYVKQLMRSDYKSNFSTNNNDQPKPKKPVIIRRNQAPPPSMNFAELLKIAEQKSKDVPVTEPLKPIKPKKVEERPLTQDELDRRRRAEENKKRRKEEEMGLRKPYYEEFESNSKPKSDSSLLRGALTKKTAGIGSPVRKNSSQITSSTAVNKGAGRRYDEEHENVIQCKPSGSAKLKPYQQEPALNPFDRIYNQIHKNKPKPVKRPREEEEYYSDEDYEDDEYDEDDDFIDDGDANEDVSKHIRDIFGYDKSKYRHIDEEDDADMEANFTTIMKEEARSAKLGRLEDLEDIRREEEELKRKKAKKMRR
ncbi:SPT2-like protein [Mya arenaria]|uniref:Protein SPT2 homolog n=1 Tax=Mya arenaria TaxID=6604 RepID=A0ABY7E1Q4_MYAAR|nr:SPT2-like protein [Mya arenaria]